MARRDGMSAMCTKREEGKEKKPGMVERMKEFLQYFTPAYLPCGQGSLLYVASER